MSKDAVWDYFTKIDSAAVGKQGEMQIMHSVGLLLLLDLFLISVALDHYPCLFNRTMSCVWQLLVYLSVSASVSAEGVVKLSASVSAESQFMTFGRVSVSAETRNSLSVGLYLKARQQRCNTMAISC